MRWLALHFPLLPLEACTRGLDPAQPAALLDGGRLWLCNAAATERGLVAGMRPGAARALVGDLRLLTREPEREAAALAQVALWACAYSAEVGLEPPHGVVLEVAASRRLFGGLDALVDAIERACSGLGYAARCALAPNPAAASLLARAGHAWRVAEGPALRQALAGLPLVALGLSPQQDTALEALGLRTLGELLRLPRDELQRRLGRDTWLRIERLLGRHPDPRPPFEPPPRFETTLELPAEVGQREALLFAARRLLFELAGYLRARGLGTRRLDWSLRHALGATRFALGLAALERDPERLALLLRERLERVVLPAPVREIGLRVAELLPFTPVPPSLFAERDGGVGEGQLLERLRARLGPEAVSVLEGLPDHRPERAWRRRPPGAVCAAASAPPRRPLWLLPQPQPLAVRDGRPWRGGPLRLVGDAERIEAGWWDGAAAGRDYRLACNAAGERFWIFRERGGARRWLLHGLFD